MTDIKEDIDDLIKKSVGHYQQKTKYKVNASKFEKFKLNFERINSMNLDLLEDFEYYGVEVHNLNSSILKTVIIRGNFQYNEATVYPEDNKKRAYCLCGSNTPLIHQYYLCNLKHKILLSTGICCLKSFGIKPFFNCKNCKEEIIITKSSLENYIKEDICNACLKKQNKINGDTKIEFGKLKGRPHSMLLNLNYISYAEWIIAQGNKFRYNDTREWILRNLK